MAFSLLIQKKTVEIDDTGHPSQITRQPAFGIESVLFYAAINLETPGFISLPQ